MQREPEAPAQALATKNTSELSPLQLAIHQVRQQGEALEGFLILFPSLKTLNNKGITNPCHLNRLKN